MCNGHGAINSQEKNVRFLRMKQFHGRWCCLETHHDSVLEGSLKKLPQHGGDLQTDPTLSLMHFRRFETQMVIFQSCIVQHLSLKRIIAPSADVASFEGQSPCAVAHENYHMSHQAF